MVKLILAICLLSVFGGVLCVQAEDEINLQEVVDKLPEDLVGKLNISALPSTEEAEKLAREKCRKESGSDDAYDKAFAAKDELKTCFTSLLNMEELKQEMEKAKPTGDLDLVFKKYCQLTPVLKQCVFNFTLSIEPCLDEQEKDHKRTFQNVTDSLADFICFKEGDRIALFIAEGGPECLTSKQEEIKKCVNTTMSKYINSDVFNSASLIDNLPKLTLDAEQCQDIDNLQNCVVTELEKCEEPTPANIVESLFKFIRNQTPCATVPQSAHSTDLQMTAGASQQMTFTIITIIVLGVSSYLI